MFAFFFFQSPAHNEIIVINSSCTTSLVMLQVRVEFLHYYYYLHVFVLCVQISANYRIISCFNVEFFCHSI